MDDVEHHLVDPLDHVLGVILEARLHAGVVEQLTDYHAGLLLVLLAVLVQLHHQVVGLVILESDVSEL